MRISSESSLNHRIWCGNSCEWKNFLPIWWRCRILCLLRGTVCEMKVISGEWIWYGQVHDFEQLIEEISDFFNQKISKNSFTVPILIPQPPVSSSSFPYLLINDPLARSTSAGRFYFQLHYNAIKKSIIITAKNASSDFHVVMTCHSLPLPP